MEPKHVSCTIHFSQNNQGGRALIGVLIDVHVHVTRVDNNYSALRK